MSALLSLLSDIEREQFHVDGYCIVHGLFSENELQEIEDFFEEFKHIGEKVFDGGDAYEEVDFTKRQLRAMHPHRYSSKALGWMIQPAVAHVLQDLLGKAPLAAQTMYYFKPPGAAGQQMHQDNFYLIAQPATCIAAWTPIDSADTDNGCLWVVPGSHRMDIICPDGGDDHVAEYGRRHIGKFPRGQKPIPVPVPRGATMFFGGNLIHGSGPNRAKDRCRRTFIGHYIDEASEQISKFYHPIINMRGETVSHVGEYSGGGPCGGDGWQGALH